MIYYILFIILGIFTVISARIKERDRRFILIVSFIIVVLFQGLRWERGTDWDTYYSMFAYPGNPKWFYEYGWFLLNGIIREYTNSYTCFLIIECGAIVLLNLRFAKYMGLNNKTAIIFNCFIGLFPVRFALASAIILNGYQFLIENNFCKFLVFVIIASTIHLASILILPFYFVPRKELSLGFMLGIYLLSIIISYFSSIVMTSLSTFNTILNLSAGDADIQNKIDGYLEGGIAEYSVRSLSSIILSFINGAFFIMLFNYFKLKLYDGDNYKRNNMIEYSIQKKQYITLLNLYVFGLCFNRIVAFTVPYLSRIGILASAGFTLLLLLGLERLYPRNIKLMYALYVIYQFISFYSNLNGMYHDLYVPYQSIF